MSATGPFSAEFAGTLGNANSALPQACLQPGGVASARTRDRTCGEIVIIDGSVGQIGALIEGSREDAQVFVLDASQDGARQIADILARDHLCGLGAIHIVAHGDRGQLRLGSATLSSAALAEAAASLSAIGAALAAGGEILIYGCSVGNGPAGHQFIAELSALTGAAVAAASHVVGGGSVDNWTLDVSTGLIAARAPFAVQALNAYRPTLTITGQLWYTIMDVPGPNPGGTTPRSVGGFVNSDGTSFTPAGALLNGSTVVTGFNVALDTAAGFMFVANSDLLTVSVYRLSDNSLVQTLQVGSKNGSSNSLNWDLVNAVAVDPINHVLFVNRWDSDTSHTGIVKISYNTSTGLLNANGAWDQAQQFLLTDASTGGNYVNATNFEIDIATHKLYYTDWDAGYSTAPFTATNAIYVVNDYTSGSPTVTKLSSQAQFPAGSGLNYIGNIAVDDAKGVIYFTTLDYNDPGQGHLWWMPITGGTATKILDIDNLNLGGVPSGLSLDPVTQQLYINLAYYDAPAAGGYPNAPTANANKVLVYQLSADGHSFSSLVTSYTLDQLEGQASSNSPGSGGAHPGASVWNQLPVLTVTGTGTHAGEQGAVLTLASSFTSSDNDGGYYNGATVQITGGTFSSNENSTADDHLFTQDGGTQRISGIYTGTNITVAFDSATEKLTLSGYDTIAHYNTVMAAMRFNSTGDNPTNYGSNTTRTLTWTVSDGSMNVTAGQGQNSGTTTITIDAVNDAPVNHLPGAAPSGNEDTTFAITGLSVTDVDANPATQNIIVALTVAHGKLTIRTDVAGGVTAGMVVGNGTNVITLTGTQNAINATLANATGLQYLGDSNFNSTVATETLTVTSNDQNNTGSGGAQQTQNSISLTVNAVNDTPVLANVGASVNATEQTAVLLDTNVAVSDVDLDPLNGGAGSYAGASLTIVRNGGANAQDSFGFDTAGANFTVSGGNLQSGGQTFATFTNNAGTLTISFTGSSTAATKALVNDVIDHIAYTNTSDAPPASVTLNYSFNDGSPANNQGSGAAGTATGSTVVNITAVNDAPILANVGPSVAATEQTAVVLDTDAVVSDVDLDGLNGGSGLYTGASLTVVRNGGANAEDSFSFDMTGATFTVSGGNLQSGGNTFATFTNAGGTLTITFTSSPTAATKALVNNVIDHIAYTNTSDTPPANVTLNYSFNDGSPGNGQGTGAAATATGSTIVNITAVNDTPVFTGLTDTPTFTEDGPAVLLDSNANATITDAELAATGNYNGAVLTLARSAGAAADDIFGTSGTLSFSGGNVLVGATIVGTFTNSAGTLAITFNANATGALVNSALQQITYSNSSDTPVASVQVHYTFSDGNTGTQGSPNTPAIGSGDITVSITSHNDAPVNHVPGAQSTAPGTDLVFSSGNGNAITVTDVDAGGGDLTVKLEAAASATLTLGSTPAGLVVDAGHPDGSHSVWITGTLTEITAALEGLKYNNPAPGSDTLQVITNDNGNTGTTGGAQQDTDSIAILVVSPISVDLDGNNSSGAAGADYNASFTGSAVAVADTDTVVTSATPITTATIKISGNFVSGGEDVLAFTSNGSTGDIAAAAFDTSTGILTLTTAGGASAAEWDAALQAVTYNDTLGAPTSTANRTIDVTVSDASSTSPAAHTTVYFHTVDLDSATGGFDAVASFIEQTPVAIAPNGTITGFDDLMSLTATLLARPDGNTLESLSLDAAAQTAASGAGLTFNYTPGTGVLLISGTASLSVYQTILDGIQYDNTSDTPTTTSRTVDVVVADGAAGNSQTHTVTIGVTAVNDAPSIAAPASIGVTEDVASALTGISFADVDAGAGIVTVTLGVASGTLAATSGGGVTAGGTASALTLSGSIANIDAFIAASNVNFTTAANATSDVTLSIDIDDGGNTGTDPGTSGTPTSEAASTTFVTLTVAAVNDAPTIVAPGSIGVTEDVASALTGISFADVDAGAGIVTVTLGVASGTLAAVSGSGVIVGGTASALTLSGSIANINAFIAASNVSFTTAANATGSVSLTVDIDDGGHTGADPGTSGTPTTEAASTTVTLNVTAVNDAPTALASSVATNEDTAKTFAATDFNFSDANDSPPNALQTVIVTSLTAHGTLKLGGTDVQVNDQIAGGLIGTLVYTPDADYNGPDSFDFQVQDDGGLTGPGAADTSTNTATMSITVNSVNDAPVLANVATSAAYPPGGGPVTLAPALTISDIDSATLSGATVRINSATTFLGDVLAAFGQTNGAVPGHPAITAVYNPGNATLTLSGVASLAEYQDVLQHITFQSLSATPTNGGANAARTVEWQVNDGSGVNNLSTPLALTDIRLHVLDLDANDSTALGTSYATAFTEKSPAVFIAGDSASDITISDIDLTGAQKITSATIVLTNAKAADSLSVLGVLSGGISAATDTTVAGQITLTLSGGTGTGATSIADYQAALHQIQFNNSSNVPDTTPRIITIVVHDSLGIDTNPAISTVSIVPVNDAPTVNSGSPSLSYTENQAATAIAPGLTLADPDSVNLVSATIAITANFHSGQDILGFVNQNGITGSYNAGAGILTLNGVSSITNYAAALESVTYFNSSDAPSADVRTIGYSVDDGSAVNHASNVGNATVTVLPVNDAPVLNGVPAAAGYSNGPALILAPGLTIIDIDSSTLTSATVHVGAGAFTGHGDVLSIGAGGLAGTSISASYNAATETLTLSGTDTLAHYQQALESVAFSTTNFGLDRAQTIEWQVNDGAAANNLSALQVTAMSLPKPPLDDFSGNGHSGILWQNVDGTPAIWLTDGVNLLSGANVGFNPGLTWHTIGTGDFSGDGKSDILWQNNDGTIAEWFVNGTSLISGGSVAFNPGSTWHAIGAGDFNGDGKADILWQNADGTPAVWLMDGLNILSGANVGFNPGPAWHVIGAGDFNGDGKADILWQNADGTPAVWLMDGLNLLSGSNVGFNPGPAWHAVGAGDFNGDGKADILWQNANGTPAVWLMDGTSVINGANVGFNPGSNWHVLNTGDYNADGKADILWQNADGTPAIWLMDGTSVINGANVGFNPGSNWHVIPHHDLLV